MKKLIRFILAVIFLPILGPIVLCTAGIVAFGQFIQDTPDYTHAKGFLYYYFIESGVLNWLRFR